MTRSTTSYSNWTMAPRSVIKPDTASSGGSRNGYSASGAAGHVIAVIPSKDPVIVHRVTYDAPREYVVSLPTSRHLYGCISQPRQTFGNEWARGGCRSELSATLPKVCL
jgi:hypothetical protein